MFFNSRSYFWVIKPEVFKLTFFQYIKAEDLYINLFYSYQLPTFPEGLILLFILFFFPFMLARKDKFNLEEIIHSYMDSTDKQIQKIKQWLRIDTNGTIEIR